MPEGYCDQETAARFAAGRDRLGRDPASASPVPLEQAAAFTPARDWSAHAMRLYSSWLSYLAARKAENIPARTSRTASARPPANGAAARVAA